MTLWLVMLACGVVTLVIRASFIMAEGHFQPAPWFQRLLPFVPIATLIALAVPEFLTVHGQISFDVASPRLWAGVVAIVVAAVWRNTLLTIASGFLVYFVLR